MTNGARAAIDAVWEPLHAKLTKLYYQDKTISKELFEKVHALIWLLHEQESLKNNILPDFEVDETTKKLRSQQLQEMIAALKTADAEALIVQLKK